MVHVRIEHNKPRRHPQNLCGGPAPFRRGGGIGGRKTTDPTGVDPVGGIHVQLVVEDGSASHGEGLGARDRGH